MPQSIRSLQEQMKKVKLEGFNLIRFLPGDYGYNSIFGHLDGKIEMVFKIPYMSDDEKVAEKIISGCFEACKSTVKNILIPATTHTLKFFTEGSFEHYSQVEYEISGHKFNMDIAKSSPSKNPALPPRFFGADEYLKNMKLTVAKNIANFEVLLNTEDFKLVSFKETYAEDFTRYYEITGTAYGRSNSFTILRADFADTNMKKRMKKELKCFKKLPLPAKEPDKVFAFDLRNYPELVDAQNMSDKVKKASYAAEGTRRASDALLKWEKYDDEVLSRVIFDTLSKIQPKIVYWRTGENFSFKEVFGEDFDKLDSNDRRGLRLLCDYGPYIFADDVILLNGESNSKKREEYLELGQKPEHNLNNTYMYIRDDDIVLNDKNEIDYNHSKVWYGSNEIKKAEHRLTYNYKVFVTPQDQYKANSLIAIFAAFNGNKEKAKEYKDKAKKIKNVAHDAKLDKLVGVI